jgi:hypothetical protein
MQKEQLPVQFTEPECCEHVWAASLAQQHTSDLQWRFLKSSASEWKTLISDAQRLVAFKHPLTQCLFYK